MSNHNKSLSSLSYCTTDGAPAMMGKRNGFISLLKAGAPKCIGMHCNLHRQVLSSKFLPVDLNDVFKDVIEIINFVKSTNLRLFMKLCKDDEAEYQRLLYYTAVRWLSRGNAFARMFELRLQVGEFLASKNHRLAEPFMAYVCVSRMAYLNNIFTALHNVNLSLQGRDINIFDAADKMEALLQRLGLWLRRVKNGQYAQFPTLDQYLEASGTSCEFNNAIVEHIQRLKIQVTNYFDSDMTSLKSKIWVTHPFSSLASNSIPDDELDKMEEFISLRTDTSLKVKFEEVKLTQF